MLSDLVTEGPVFDDDAELECACAQEAVEDRASFSSMYERDCMVKDCGEAVLWSNASDGCFGVDRGLLRGGDGESGTTTGCALAMTTLRALRWRIEVADLAL